MVSVFAVFMEKEQLTQKLLYFKISRTHTEATAAIAIHANSWYPDSYSYQCERGL